MLYLFGTGTTDPLSAGLPTVGMTTVSPLAEFTISLPVATSLPSSLIQVIDFQGNATYWDSGAPFTIPVNSPNFTNIDLFGDGSWYWSARTEEQLDPADFQPFARIRVPEPSRELLALSCVVALVGLRIADR
jgi:hypothetical protein